MLDFLNKGYRVEIGPGSIVVICRVFGHMREYGSISAAHAMERALRP